MKIDITLHPADIFTVCDRLGVRCSRGTYSRIMDQVKTVASSAVNVWLFMKLDIEKLETIAGPFHEHDRRDCAY